MKKLDHKQTVALGTLIIAAIGWPMYLARRLKKNRK